MLIDVLYGLLVMGVCLLLQSVLVVAAFRYYTRRHPILDRAAFWPNMRVIYGTMLILVTGNIAQIAIWALLFRLLGEFAVFSDALYHSAVNFTTLGYGDIVMTEKNRLLGPLESMNGVLMIGVSTAVLMAFFQDTLKRTFRVGRKPKYPEDGSDR